MSMLVLLALVQSAEDYIKSGQQKADRQDYSEAIKDFTRAIELDPRSSRAYGKRGNARYWEDDYDGAVADATRAVELDPKDAWAFGVRALAKLGKEDFKGAKADLDRALELEPNSSSSYVTRGLYRSRQGDQDGAMADYTRAIELDPDSAVAYNNRGVLKSQKQDPEGALADFSKACELNPADPLYFRNRASTRNRKGDVDGAMADLDRAIELAPGYTPAYTLRASLKRGKGDLKGALADLNRAVEVRPSDWQGYSARAYFKEQDEDRDGALADLHRAIELSPKRASLHVSRGNLRRKMGHQEEALKDFTQAVLLDPKIVAGYLGRAAVREDRGDFLDAKSDYAKAIELDPKNARAYKRRGYLHFRLRAWDQSLSDLRRACELDPSDQDYPRAFIWILRAKCGEREGATRELKEYMAAHKDAASWSAKNLRFLSGDLKESDYLRDAGTGSDKDALDRKCEAYFYSGILRLLEKQIPTASQYFWYALETDRHTFIEYDAAVAELRALGEHVPARDVLLLLASAWKSYCDWSSRSRDEAIAAALADCSKAIDRDPKFAEAYRMRGEYRSSLNPTRSNVVDPDILADFNRAVELRPGSGLMVYARARYLRFVGRDGDAEKDLTRAIELDFSTEDCLLQRASIREKLGRLDEAIDDYSRVGSRALLYRAEVRRKKGDLDGAIADCRAYLKDPEHARTESAHEALVACLLAKGDSQGALQALDEGATATGNGPLRERRFWITLEAGRLDDARTDADLMNSACHRWLVEVRRGKQESLAADLRAEAKKTCGSSFTHHHELCEWKQQLPLFLVGEVSEEDLIGFTRKWEELKSKTVEAYYYIGWKAHAAGDRDAAKVAFRKCLKAGKEGEYYARAEEALQFLEK